MFKFSFYYLGVMLLLGCTNNDNKPKDATIPVEDVRLEVNYQKIIDSLGAGKLYNETKWLMYCIHCDVLPEWRKAYSHLPKRPCAFLDLKLMGVEKKDSIIKIWCDFYYNDTLSYNINTVENYTRILDGVEFNINSGKHRYLNGTASFVEVNPLSRFDNELQKDVIRFISQNKDSLNPWFREEANHRGVLRN
jgi:hypothetical protein